MANQVDRLFVGLGMDKSEFDESLKTATEQMDQWGQEMKKTGKTLTKSLTAPIAGAVTALTGLTSKTTQYADRIDKASEKTGLQAEELQKLKFAAEQSGASMETIVSTAGSFDRRLAQVVEGTGRANEAFQKLGLSIRNQAGEMKAQGQVYKETLRRLADLDNAQKRATLGAQLFGRQYQDLQPLLNQGSQGIDALMARAEELGIVMGDEQISNFVKLKDRSNELWGQLKQVGRTLASGLLPVLDALTPTVEAFIERLRGLSEWFRDLSTTTKTWIGIIGGAAAAIGPALVVLGTLTQLLAGLPALFSAIGSAAGAAWAAITGPVGLVVGAIAAVGTGAYLVINNWEAVKGFFQKLTRGIIEHFKGLKKNLLGVFQKVKFYLATKVLEGVREMLEGVQKALDFLGVEKFTGEIEGAIGSLNAAVEEGERRVKGAQKRMDEGWDMVTGGAMQFASDVGDMAASVKNSVVDMVTFTRDKTEGMFDEASIEAQQRARGAGGRVGTATGEAAPVAGLDEIPTAGLNQVDSGDPLSVKALQENITGLQEPLKEFGKVGKRAFGQMGSEISKMIVGLQGTEDAFRSMVRIGKRLLAQLIQKLVQAVVKGLLFKAIMAAFGGGGGAALPVMNPGVSGADILGKSAAAGVAGKSLGITTGSASLAKGQITIPVEMTSEANDEGKRRRQRKGRRP